MAVRYVHVFACNDAHCLKQVEPGQQDFQPHQVWIFWAECFQGFKLAGHRGLELPQEAEVVFGEEADVVNAVLRHRHPVYAEAPGKAGVAL